MPRNYHAINSSYMVAIEEYAPSQKSKQGTFQATVEMKAAIGAKDSELEQVMATLGFSTIKSGNVLKFRQKLRQPKSKKRSRRRKNLIVNPDSPFAELYKLAKTK